jgi:hypothetical protein
MAHFRQWFAHGARASQPALLSLVALEAAGCGQPVVPIDPNTTTTLVEKITYQNVDKIDILLAIDNSRSMADKQEVLAAAVPDLLRGLVNPLCIDVDTQLPDAQQPAGPLDDCVGSNSKRQVRPVLDIHIGIVSSSLGGLQNGCDTSKPGNDKVGLDDRGRLVARLDKNGTAADTYLGKGFLAWDPTQEKHPKLDESGKPILGEFEPGEADLDSDSAADANTTALTPSLTDMVKGVGQLGCGYEATLEATYRFLNDPAPSAAIVLEGGQGVPQGIDEVLLAQRADFLRPDSLVAVVALSDENDCSMPLTGQFYVAGKTDNGYHLPPARSPCLTNPNDECCFSCGQADVSGCVPKTEDPACVNPSPGDDEVRDSVNLRCFDQKRRFGIDFLHPIERYTEGFSSLTLTTTDGSQVPNPLFPDPSSVPNGQVRDPSLVFFAGIVGVPWQDIARDPSDLTKGLKNTDELSVTTAAGYTGWDLLLGNPANGVDPVDPLMKESFEKRTGVHPITGEPLGDETSAQGNSVNGHEYPIPARDDLQYACIFPLSQPRDCSDPATSQGCDCPTVNDPADQTSKPLCNPDPALDHLQTHAKAYPGTRFLSTIRSLGSQGIVGSVCPKQLTDPTAGDYGYRPAIQEIVNRLTSGITQPCTSRQLEADPSSGQVECLLLEARYTGGQCSCDLPGRDDVPAESSGVVTQAKKDPAAANADCFCLVTQLAGDELAACQNDVSPNPKRNGEPVDGWCYVDATSTPPVGNPAIVEGCPDGKERSIRFVGKGEIANYATLFITCAGS